MQALGQVEGKRMKEDVEWVSYLSDVDDSTCAPTHVLLSYPVGFQLYSMLPVR